jgi:WD40 repeat protein
LPGHAGWVAAVAFTLAPSGTLLLVSGGGDNTVRLWDPRSGACLLVLPRLSPVRSLATSGLLLAIGENEGLSVIELADPTAPDGD